MNPATGFLNMRQEMESGGISADSPFGLEKSIVCCGCRKDCAQTGYHSAISNPSM
jgi:hypothetical protein